MIDVNLRPVLARHLRQRLQAFQEGFRHNLAILGPQGSGKTFQLQQLLANPPPALLLIYCPLYRESPRSFLSRWLASVLQAGLAAAPGPAQAAHSTASSLETLLQQAEGRLPKTAAAARAVEPLLARRLYAEAFTRTLDTIPVLTEERGRSCVVLLDEFLYLEDIGFGHAFHELGKRVMTWPSTLFILSSSSVYRARTILRERLQLLFGQFEFLALDALDPAAVGPWVQQMLKGLRGSKAASPFLMQWLGAYPWYLSVFLKRLKELGTLQQRLDFTEALFLETAWDVLGRPEGPLHQQCRSRTEGLARGRSGARAMDALIQIAAGARTATELGRRMGRGGLADALQLLIEQDLAQRNGTCWMVPDPILRCWLSTVLAAHRAVSHPDGAEVRTPLERYLRGLWTQWMQTHQLSFSEQVIELFSQFSEETVCLDAKTGRLPKFHTIQRHPPDLPGAETYIVANGDGKRWCATVQEGPVEESTIATFDAFCRRQIPKPSRKVVVTKSPMGQHARLLAKAANMWVWEPDELGLLMELYGRT